MCCSHSVNGKLYRYLESGRLDFKDETKLSMDAEEYKAWQQRTTSEQSASTSSSPPQFHFICDCFFLTMKALHLGYSNLINTLAEHIPRVGFPSCPSTCCG